MLFKLAIPASWCDSVIKVSGTTTTSRPPISQRGVSPYYDNLHRWITDPTLSLTLQDSVACVDYRVQLVGPLFCSPVFFLAFECCDRLAVLFVLVYKSNKICCRADFHTSGSPEAGSHKSRPDRWRTHLFFLFLPFFPSLFLLIFLICPYPPCVLEFSQSLLSNNLSMGPP